MAEARRETSLGNRTFDALGILGFQERLDELVAHDEISDCCESERGWK